MRKGVVLIFFCILLIASVSAGEVSIYNKENNLMITEEDFKIDLPKIEKVSVSVTKATMNVAIGKKKVQSTSDSGKRFELQSNEIIPWGVERVGAPLAWSKSAGDKIKVAILDTGIDYNHPDLNVAGGISFISGDYKDDVGHGTMVAGVLSSLENELGIIGVAPKIELYSVKVMAEDGGFLSDIIEGIDWAINNDMDIISMSFGTEINSEIFELKLAEAYDNGILIVAAAGNEGEVLYPAKYDNVISVSNVDENNDVSFGGFGPELDFVAPGTEILTTYPNKSYVIVSGTSFSAPHVAGIAALILEDNNLSPDEIKSKLIKDSIDLGEKGKDEVYGWGLIQINLEKENATIIFTMPQESNSSKYKLLQTDPIKIEIYKTENEQEKLIDTLFYEGKERNESLSVEAGRYKIVRYFEEEVEEEYILLKDGEMVVVPLHKVNPPVHQWIAYQASLIWSTEEINNFINKNDYSTIWLTDKDHYCDSGGYHNSEGILVGTCEEDKDSTDENSCDDGNLGTIILDKPYCYHFWNPDIPQNGDYNSGWTYGGTTTAYDSSYVRAQRLWDNKVVPLYNSGDLNGSYYWLGRVTHLLEDASIPAHTHDDTHLEIFGIPIPGIGDDEYEDFFKDYDNSWNDGLSNWKHFVGSDYIGQQYNHENINLPKGIKTNPSNLFKLFYYTAQKTQYYASDDVAGNSIYKKEGDSSSYSFSPSLWQGESVIIFSDKDDLENFWGIGNEDNLKKEAEALTPHAMKAVAGLYRLFWIETKGIGCPGVCCDEYDHYKLYEEQPTGLLDYNFCSGNNVYTRNYYCNGNDADEHHTNIFNITCKENEICKNGECEPKLEQLNITYISLKNNQNYSKRRLPFNIQLNKQGTIEYIDYKDTRPRWRELCDDCSSYYDTKRFSEGKHNLKIKAYASPVAYKTINFTIDSKDPHISRTYPRRNKFTNGSNFYVKFKEENPGELVVYYGNSFVTENIDIDTECDFDGRYHQCEIDLNLTQFDNLMITYYFEIDDIAGNKDESRPTEIMVDTIPPNLTNPDSFLEERGKYIYFGLNITEKNFDEVVLSYYYRGKIREKRICSRLRYGRCEKKLRMKDYYRNSKLLITDEAGNSLQKDIVEI